MEHILNQELTQLRGIVAFFKDVLRFAILPGRWHHIRAFLSEAGLVGSRDTTAVAAAWLLWAGAVMPSVSPEAARGWIKRQRKQFHPLHPANALFVLFSDLEAAESAKRVLIFPNDEMLLIETDKGANWFAVDPEKEFERRAASKIIDIDPTFVAAIAKELTPETAQLRAEILN